MNDRSIAERRPVQGFTINGVYSKGLDNALWIERTRRGNYFVSVSITDVASLIPKGSEFDIQALHRSFTRNYELKLNPDVHPMLPLEISEREASLLPWLSRNTITVIFNLSDKAELLNPPTILKTQLKSCEKFSFDRVEYLMKYGIGSYRYQLNRLYDLARWLHKKRTIKGAISIPTGNEKWSMNEEGGIKKLLSSGHRANLIVQEFMIATNCAVANFLVENQAPAIFRNHTIKDETFDMDEFKKLVSDSVKIGTPGQIEKIRRRMERAFNPAEYSSDVAGHSSLSVPVYTHFTSPLQRYPDLVVQRIVSAIIDGKSLPYSSNDLRIIANHVNTVQEKLKADEENYWKVVAPILKERVNKKDYSGLNTPLFRKVIERTLETGLFNPELISEIERRFTSRELGVRSATLILLDKRWADLAGVRSMIIGSFQENPDFARSILGIIRETGICTKPYEVLVKPEDSEDDMYHVSAIMFSERKKYESDDHVHLDRQTAVDMAHTSLLLQLLPPQGVEVVVPETVVSNEKLGNREIVWRTDFDAKSALNDFVMENKLPLPKYEACPRRVGGITAFSAICILEIGGEIVRSNTTTLGSSKKRALQIAALDVLEQLQKMGHNILPKVNT